MKKKKERKEQRAYLRKRMAEGTNKILVKEQTSGIKDLAEGSMNFH